MLVKRSKREELVDGEYIVVFPGVHEGGKDLLRVTGKNIIYGTEFTRVDTVLYRQSTSELVPVAKDLLRLFPRKINVIHVTGKEAVQFCISHDQVLP